MNTPYDIAAREYLDWGWWPIPVRGKNPPVTGATGYEGVVSVEKVRAWLDTDPLFRARAGRGASLNNLAIRHRLTLAIDVDAGYGSKDGVAQLAAYAQRLGLDPLPPTWSSTARGPETGSRQYMYRIREDSRLKTKPCPSVEICNWHHRFSVVWPSIHPNTGGVYTWYSPGCEGTPPTWGPAADRIPVPDELPMLPDPWFTAFLGSTPNADRSAVTVELPELLATFRTGEPGLFVQEQINKWSSEENHLGHDETKDALIHTFLLGREGHIGVHQLYELIVRRFTQYVTEARPNQAKTEIASLIKACATIAQQKRCGPVVIGRMPTVAEFMAGAIVHLDAPADTDPQQEQPGRASSAATSEELSSWLVSFTANNRPDRLHRRLGWMLADPVARLSRHAEQLVVGSLVGDFAAEDVVLAVATACRHHGYQDHETPYQLLSGVLGAALDALGAGV